MSVYVYLGPTMPVAEAQEILPDAVFLPPAAQSDILSLVESVRPKAILLIDGVFMQSLSVWHKEILYALECGVAVYGASSMGALRAAETACFGTIGVGKIFNAFLSGELTDDDEVAVVHAPKQLGFKPASAAMVNIRATLASAQEQGVLNTLEHDTLIGLAKRRFFPERSYKQLLEDAKNAGVDSLTLTRLGEFIVSAAIDQKREDALLLLTHIRDHGPVAPPPVKVTRSHVFMSMYQRDRQLKIRGTSIALADVGAYAALHVDGFDDINEQALNNALVDVLGERLDVKLEEGDVAAELSRFSAKRRLKTEDDLLAWQQANGFTQDGFDEFIRKQAIRRRLRNWYISRKYLERTTQEVLDELRLRGEFPEVADSAARQKEILQATRDDTELLHDDSTLVELIREHARHSRWRPKVDIGTWAFESGFKDITDVQYELIKAKLARHALVSIIGTLQGSESGDARSPHERPIDPI